MSVGSLAQGLPGGGPEDHDGVRIPTSANGYPTTCSGNGGRRGGTREGTAYRSHSLVTPRTAGSADYSQKPPTNW